MSKTDALTGLNNRQALKNRLEEESLRIERYHSKHPVNLAMAFIDMDNFKYYNDTFGHNIGDLVIREFSGLLRETFREIDFIARFGGDEFIILLPETDESQATYACERILQALKESDHFNSEIEKAMDTQIEIPDEKLITCSIGIASYRFHSYHPKNLEKLMTYADKALYEAKNKGKNQVSIWGEE